MPRIDETTPVASRSQKPTSNCFSSPCQRAKSRYVVCRPSATHKACVNASSVRPPRSNSVKYTMIEHSIPSCEKNSRARRPRGRGGGGMGIRAT
jgi:hypothetical protein